MMKKRNDIRKYFDIGNKEILKQHILNDFFYHNLFNGESVVDDGCLLA